MVCLILVNTAGEVTVADVSNLENMLGSTPERGHAITAAHNGQFFMLELVLTALQCDTSIFSSYAECDTTVFSYSRLSSLSGEPVAGEEEEGEEEGLGLSQTYMVLRHMLYSLTENENFRPPLMKGRRKVIKYSLLCLKSVTPQECYERKMSKEEYGEALVLAKQYGLDCDLVYQRQWYNNPVTIATIQDYLSKVSKEEWVIQECMNRVARDYETTRELLQYGLVKTSFREVMECGSEGSDSHCDEEKEGELSLEAMEAELTKCERFTAQQTKLCQYRHILLSYMDSLLTYEAILGGPIAADEHFDDEFFVNFRSKNLVQATIEYAQEGNGRAVEILFTHHSQVILPHSLPVLSNFPETTSVKSYKSLLPYIDGDGGVVLVGLEQEPHRVQDWSELPVVRQHCLIPMDAHLNLGKFLYEETPAWKKYQAPVTSDVITTWYQERAREIEQYSGLVDNALALGLDLIHHHLKTLYTLVYQCNCNSTVTLSQVESMSDLEKLHRMTKEARGSPTFITAFVQMAVPFLSRVEGMEGGKARRQLLEQCMVSLAKVVSQPQAPQGKAIIRDVGDMMSLALKCVYSCERCEQLDAADRILECLPMGTTGLSEELHVLHKDIDKLEDHLSAMEILNLYGTQKPISHIRNIQDSPAEAKQLMVRLTRGASRQPSSGSQETFWRNLLQHLLTLRGRVFTCVEPSTCYQVFTESLLCSGQEANIQLASQLLTSSLQTPSRSESQISKATPPSGFSYQLPYDKSVELVVYAAREYFNSAANYRDRDMSLAKSCLALIKDCPAAIQSELNLFSSLEIVEGFGLGLLPLQVRLCENKLDIIKRVLKECPDAYKQSEKLFRLAHLLGLDGVETPVAMPAAGIPMTPGQGHTSILIANTAIEKEDFRFAHKLCSQLMSAQFPPAWEVCRKLAGQGQFKELQSKLELTSFVLTHCPEEELRHVLKERGAMEVQLLSAESHDSGRSSIIGRSVQQIVTKGTGVVQQFIRHRPLGVLGKQSDQDVIEECLEQLGDEVERLCNEEQVERMNLALSYHPFYTTDGMDVHNQASYGSYEIEPAIPSLQLKLTQRLLRAQKVAESLADRERQSDCTQILVRLAMEYSDLDTHLMLSYLLALPQVTAADQLFSKMAVSKVSLQLAIYYACLQIYARTAESSDGEPLLCPPATLMSHVISHVIGHSTAEWPVGVQPAVELLQCYRTQLCDHVQAETLLGLGTGIDVQRFTQDLDYRRETILSLARTMDTNMFKTAQSLAKPHKVAEWELYMALTTWLLTDHRQTYSLVIIPTCVCSLPVSDAQKKLGDPRIAEVLLSNPQETASRLQEDTYPLIPGTKYGLLLVFYTLLQQCAEEEAEIKNGDVDLSIHVSLLKKFKSAVRGMDYKTLMTGEDSVSVLRPALLATNVHLIAKLAAKIPCKACDNGFLSSEVVFRVFAEKLFMTGDGKQTEPQDKLPLSTRIELLGRLLKLWRRALNGASSAEVTGSSEEGHNSIAMEMALEHLRSVHTAALKRPQECSEEQWSSFMNELEFSFSQTDKVYAVCSKMVASGLRLDVVGTVLDVTHKVQPHTMSVLSLVQEALSHALEELRHTDSEPQDVLCKIETVISSVRQHEQESGRLVSSGQVLAIIRPHCSDSSHTVDTRRALLHIIEKHLTLSEDDLNLLILYQTQAILLNQFAVLATLEHVSSAQGRTALFTTLLRQASTLDQLQVLECLLETWGEDSRFPVQESWCELMEAMSSVAEGATGVILARAGRSHVPEEVDEAIWHKLSSGSVVDGLKYSLVAGGVVMKKSLEQLQQESAVPIMSADVFELLIVKKQVSLVVSLPFYIQLSAHLQSPQEDISTELFTKVLSCSASELSERLSLNQPAKRVREVAQQLFDGGFKAAAGSLVLSTQQFHPNTLTVSDGVTYVNRLMRR
eukprot:Em0009g249a